MDHASGAVAPLDPEMAQLGACASAAAMIG